MTTSMIVSINPEDLVSGQSYTIVCFDGSSISLPFVQMTVMEDDLYYIFRDEKDGYIGLAHSDFNTGRMAINPNQ